MVSFWFFPPRESWDHHSSQVHRHGLLLEEVVFKVLAKTSILDMNLSVSHCVYICLLQLAIISFGLLLHFKNETLLLPCLMDDLIMVAIRASWYDFWNLIRPWKANREKPIFVIILLSFWTIFVMLYSWHAKSWFY